MAKSATADLCNDHGVAKISSSGAEAIGASRLHDCHDPGQRLLPPQVQLDIRQPGFVAARDLGNIVTGVRGSVWARSTVDASRSRSATSSLGLCGAMKMTIAVASAAPITNLAIPFGILASPRANVMTRKL